MSQTVGQYLGKDKGPVISQHAVSEEYRVRHVETFGDHFDRYCKTCGRLPAWCECASAEPVGSVKPCS